MSREKMYKEIAKLHQEETSRGLTIEALAAKIRTIVGSEPFLVELLSPEVSPCIPPTTTIIIYDTRK